MALSSSIVLCTYNGARFLDAQWSSLLTQSRLPDEIVVRDDASTDATLQSVRRLAGNAVVRGLQVRVTSNPRNIGYVRNFEAAMRDATGDVLLLCDQDDVWHPDKLATLLREFERRPELLLLCTDARRIDAAGAVLRRSLFDVLRITAQELRRIHAGGGFEVLLRRSLATGATIALRRTLLRDALPIAPGWVHDEWLAIAAAARGGFDCLGVRLIDYRQHGDNQIGMPDRGFAAKWRDLRRPRAELIERLIRRAEALLARMPSSGRSGSESLDRVRIRDRLAHLHVRASITGWPWMRVRVVFRELMSGRYRRHCTGWRSALRDLMRRS